MFAPGQIDILIRNITRALFQHENDRIRKQELHLVQQNRQLSKDNHDGFYFQGKFYTDLDDGVGHYKGKSHNIHVRLVPELQILVKDQKEIDFDKQRISQALALLLMNCIDYQDVRDALPNALAEIIGPCQGLARSRPEAWTIKDKPFKMAQYEKLREKIEFYTASRLFY